MFIVFSNFTLGNENFPCICSIVEHHTLHTVNMERDKDV